MTNKVIVRPAQEPLETDILLLETFVQAGIGAFANNIYGTGTFVSGLQVSQQATPNMSVSVGPGVITCQTITSPIAFSSLGTDNTPVMKFGINTTTTTINLPAPTTAGHSINYLIEAQFSEVDTDLQVLPYYNPDNPDQALAGPNNSSLAEAYVRAQLVDIEVVSGTDAATGSQTTPNADSGFVPLAIVTVTYGQTSILNGNIVTHQNAPYNPFQAIKDGIQISSINSNGTNNPARIHLAKTNTSLVTSTRWSIDANSATESGSLVGTNLEFRRYNNLGVYVDSPVSFDRSTGTASFTHIPLVPYAPNGDASSLAASTGWVKSQYRRQMSGWENVYVNADTTNAYTGLPGGSATWGASLTWQPGNDSTGDGTAAKPFQSIQKAMDYYGANVDFGQNGINIWLAPTSSVTLRPTYACYVHNGTRHPDVQIFGDVTTPTNCQIVANLTAPAYHTSGATAMLAGLYLKSTGWGTGALIGTGQGIVSSLGSVVSFRNLNFGPCADAHMLAQYGSFITCIINPDTGFSYPYTISGSAWCHAYSSVGSGVTVIDMTITVTGSVTFYAFLYTEGGGFISWYSAAFAGTYTSYGNPNWNFYNNLIMPTVSLHTTYSYANPPPDCTAITCAYSAVNYGRLSTGGTCVTNVNGTTSLAVTTGVQTWGGYVT